MKPKKLSQTQIVLNVLRDSPGEWFLSYQLCKVQTKYGWLGLQAPRRARELAEANEIEREDEGKYAKYRVPADKVIVL